MFARSNNEGELWVLILEKAWAKLWGSYARTEGGSSYFAAAHLIGSPGSIFVHKKETEDLDHFWNLLVSFD
jgi:calpain-15